MVAPQRVRVSRRRYKQLRLTKVGASRQKHVVILWGRWWLALQSVKTLKREESPNVAAGGLAGLWYIVCIEAWESKTFHVYVFRVQVITGFSLRGQESLKVTRHRRILAVPHPLARH
jgi:hypothetical protein